MNRYHKAARAFIRLYQIDSWEDYITTTVPDLFYTTWQVKAREFHKALAETCCERFHNFNNCLD